jgi:hypothetical protein
MIAHSPLHFDLRSIAKAHREFWPTSGAADHIGISERAESRETKRNRIMAERRAAFASESPKSANYGAPALNSRFRCAWLQDHPLDASTAIKPSTTLELRSPGRASTPGRDMVEKRREISDGLGSFRFFAMDCSWESNPTQHTANSIVCVGRTL